VGEEWGGVAGLLMGWDSIGGERWECWCSAVGGGFGEWGSREGGGQLR